VSWFGDWFGQWFGDWAGNVGARPLDPDAHGASAGVTIVPRDTLVTVTERACEQPTVKPRVEAVHVVARSCT
jgi:hypothetical protein